MFGVQKLRMEKAPKQKGGKDCGLFAIAIATALAHFGLDGAMASTSYNQCGMRDLLLICFENMCLAPFPQLQLHAYYIILAEKPAFGGLHCYGASSTAAIRRRSDDYASMTVTKP